MEDFAEMLTDTRLNISTALNDMQDNGLIKLSRKKILVPELATLIDFCKNKKEKGNEQMNTHRENPFLHAYGTPHETVPFNRIELNDYEPAIREGMNEEDREIERITDNTEPPTFENTILALENSGALLERVTTVFFNLMSAETCDEMDALAEKMMPELSEHSNNISLNPKLFSRIKQVYAQKNR